MVRKHLVLILATLAWGGCAHADPRLVLESNFLDIPIHDVSVEPRLGERVAVNGRIDYHLLLGCNAFPVFQVRYQGIVYRVVFGESNRIIRYISTTDPRFSTPEGIRVGSSLAEVLRQGANYPVATLSRGYHTLLPSGWYAEFEGLKNDEPSRTASTVKWLFRR